MYYLTDDKMKVRFLTACSDGQFLEFVDQGYAACLEENRDLKIGEVANWLLERRIPFVADMRLSIPEEEVTGFVLCCVEPEYEICLDSPSRSAQERREVIFVPAEHNNGCHMFLSQEAIEMTEQVILANRTARENGLLISAEERSAEIRKKTARRRSATIIPFPEKGRRRGTSTWRP